MSALRAAVGALGPWSWVAAGLTVLVIWWPLDFGLLAAQQAWSRLAIVTIRPEWPALIRDGVANVLAFLPFGIIARASSTLRVRDVALVALGLGVLLEVGQVFQVGRIISMADVLTNGVGAALGASCADGARLVLGSRRRSLVPPIPLTLFMSALAIAAVLLLQARFGDLSPWAMDTTLQIGNEATGERPWCGTVRDLVWEVGERRWTETDLRLEARGHTGPVAGSCPESQWRQTAEPPRDLLDAIQATGQFRLRLVATSASIAQSGPARILSLSLDNTRRNFTIAQDGADLVLRLRRRWSGQNGVRPYFRMAGVFDASAPIEILVVLSSDSTIVSAGGHTLRYHHDVTSQWWMMLVPSVEARSSPLDAAARTAFWIVLLGPLAAVLGARASRGEVGRAQAFVLIAGSALLAFLVVHVGHGPSDLVALPSMAAAAAVSTWTGIVVSRRHNRSGVETTSGGLVPAANSGSKASQHNELEAMYDG